MKCHLLHVWHLEGALGSDQWLRSTSPDLSSSSRPKKVEVCPCSPSPVHEEVVDMALMMEPIVCCPSPVVAVVLLIVPLKVTPILAPSWTFS